MKYKLLPVFFAFFLIGLFVQAGVAYAGVSLSLSPANRVVSLDEKLSLEVKLDTGGVKTDEAEVVIAYDDTKLSVSEAVLGWIYDDRAKEDTSQPGKIVLRASSLPGLSFTGSETFAWLTFKTTATGMANVSIEMPPKSKVSYEGKNLLASVTNGSYTILAGGFGASTATPSGTPTPTATPTVRTSPTATPTGLPETGWFEPTALSLGLGAALILMAVSLLIFI